jgi:hypothetical protein
MNANHRFSRVTDLLVGHLHPGTPVVVKGWVRTRRDSKAGLSFVNVHDGSCLESIQVVAPGDLPNYQSEVKRLTSGCSVVVHGELVATPNRPQPYEVRTAASTGSKETIRPRNPHARSRVAYCPTLAPTSRTVSTRWLFGDSGSTGRDRPMSKPNFRTRRRR